VRIAVLFCALLAGCTAHIHIDGGRSLATIIGLSFLAAAAYSDEQGSPSREPPELDPNRRVSEQDCSKPIDYTLGNIRCK
jgi:hypothetical protein